VGTLRYQINAQITLDSYISDRYKLHFGSSVELQATLNLKVVGNLWRRCNNSSPRYSV